MTLRTATVLVGFALVITAIVVRYMPPPTTSDPQRPVMFTVSTMRAPVDGPRVYTTPSFGTEEPAHYTHGPTVEGQYFSNDRYTDLSRPFQAKPRVYMPPSTRAPMREPIRFRRYIEKHPLKLTCFEPDGFHVFGMPAQISLTTTSPTPTLFDCTEIK